MKLRSSCIVVAMLAACGAAGAQSSVTVYGRFDVRAFKDIGTDAKALGNGSGSRLGFRGVESLGGGWSAFFDLQHRFNADTGAQTNAQHYFQHSFVGLDGGNFGRVWFGRDYTPAYIDVYLRADPFEHGTIGSLLTINNGGISALRVDNSINYRVKRAGFSATVQVAEGNDPPLNNFRDRQYSTSLVYSSGPFSVGLGYENPGNARDHWSLLTAIYTVGPVVARLGLGQGKTSTGQERQSLSLGATYTLGSHRLRAAYGKLENETGNVDISKKLAVGWEYVLSKRTNLYAGYAHESARTTLKSGYDVGMKHNF